ncbi:DUF1642 domain-containing protein [Enterococcus avium]|uniref:DUF1642 domain-containing protein n=1 Tax=Enterococcus avium TaxID=33945 RepID=UPI0034A1FD38
MNKQEVLEELETTSTQFFHVATSTGVEANNKTLSTGVFAGLGIAKSVLTKLDEPQKVKVPAFVAEKMKRYKSALWMLSSEYFDTSSEVDSDELANWIDQNSETFFRAWLDGYEVEEEPKWVVKVDDNAYFVDFFDSLTPHLVDGLGWEVMRLDDKSKADAVALIIGGKAEKA